MTFQRVSLDLLGDPDIQNMMKKSYSLEDLSRIDDEDEDEFTSDSEEGDEADMRYRPMMTEGIGHDVDEYAEDALVRTLQQPRYANMRMCYCSGNPLIIS